MSSEYYAGVDAGKAGRPLDRYASELFRQGWLDGVAAVTPRPVWRGGHD
jgi:hypothetical protein